MELLCVISATQSEVVSEKNSDVEKDIRKASIGVKKLHKVVTKIYYNLPVFPIHSDLILSTDDTVNYIFEGKGSDNGSFRLISSKENTNSVTRSNYKNEDTNNICGLRVKINYTFSAADTMDPKFISVLGLREIDPPKELIFLIKITVIYVGGGGVNAGAQQYGIIIFIRGENTIDKNRSCIQCFLALQVLIDKGII